jgi:hypothetical protein
MKVLTEADVLRVMREEWGARLGALTELAATVSGEVISNELKVKHKVSGLRYTIDSIGRDDVVLRTPEGKHFLVDKQHLQSEYELG